MENQEFCVKLVYENFINERFDRKIIYGMITGEDNQFIFFKTARKKYRIARQRILLVEQTNMPFVPSSPVSGEQNV